MDPAFPSIASSGESTVRETISPPHTEKYGKNSPSPLKFSSKVRHV